MRYNITVDPRLRIQAKTLGETCALPVHVPFVGEFSEESGKKFRESLEAAENLARDAGQEIIPVTIDSYGGSCYALMGMIDAINNCSIPIATIVESKAMSCGAILFSCGAEGHRYVGANATVMIHSVSSYAMGKIEELKADVAEANRLDEHLFRLLSRNCGHKDNYFHEQLKDRMMADWFLTPEECVKQNLANKIGIPQIKVDISLETSFG